MDIVDMMGILNVSFLSLPPLALLPPPRPGVHLLWHAGPL